MVSVVKDVEEKTSTLLAWRRSSEIESPERQRV